MYSIIIPVYNEEKHIGPLIESILESDFKDYEVIIVDDKSTDSSVSIIKKYPVRLIQLEKNSGAAKARNTGAENARGKILLFLDSDVIVHKNTLKEIDKTFKEKADAKVVIGIYSKNPTNKGFFPKFKALLDYYIFTSPKSEKVTSFEPRCGAVEKKLFEEVGRFDTNFKGATVEDYELGYRLLKKADIYINKKAQVDHSFDGFIKTTKNFRKRGFMWFQLFLKRKKFDNVGTTSSAGIGRGCAPLSLFFFFIASLIYSPLIYLALICLLVYFIHSLKFFKLIFKEKGLFFTLASILVDFFLSTVLAFAAFEATVDYFIFRKSNKPREFH